MGVADDLPDQAIRLGKADHGQGVILVPLRNIHGHVFVEPVVTTDDVGHAAKGLENDVTILPDEKLMELLGGVGGGAIVAILGRGFPHPESQHQEQGGPKANHPRLSSELCGKAPASP